MKDKWEREFEKAYLQQKNRYWTIMAIGFATTVVALLIMLAITKMI